MNTLPSAQRCVSTFIRLLILPLLAGLAAPGQVVAHLHHDLEIEMDPAAHRLSVTDRITLPAPSKDPLAFRIHAGLDPRVETRGVTLTRIDDRRSAAANQADLPLEVYMLTLSPEIHSFTLSYGGTIHHPVAERGAEYAGSFGVSPGLIGPQGVFLSGASGWYPDFGAQTLDFDLAIDLPPSWRSVSQGWRSGRMKSEQSVHEQWEARTPQEEIYLIAGEFTEYSRPVGKGQAKVQARVFLRRPDPALAARYLEATGQYLAMYDELIGPYAYPKFALVENFWETGYGMPSFTLLGSRVIRLPFILHSSYPHEILHNWWGNGVYVDYASGNWSEGLTAYLADYLIKEQQGRGTDYRRATLQKYTDYVRSGQDFPLTAFRSRHSAATQAVGYGKTLMLFHMLRLRLGDGKFVEGLRRLYRDRRFRVTSFDDVHQAFSAVSGRPLKTFFRQWVDRVGAPRLRVRDARVEADGQGFRLTARIEQTQEGRPYHLRIPVAVTLKGMDQAFQTRVAMDSRTEQIELRLPARPLRLDLDPEFDVFRRLDRAEVPPALSQAFGAEFGIAVIPSAAPPMLRRAYRKLAEAWQQGRQLQIVSDSELETLPSDRAIWLLGWENRFRAELNQALAGYDFAAEGTDTVRILDRTLSARTNALALVGHNPRRPEQAIAWIASRDPTALAGLTRKLPHYGKYSYLGFRGDAPDNILKGQWPVVDSPLSLTIQQPDGSRPQVPRARLATRHALAEPTSVFSADRMHQDIAILAASNRGGKVRGETNVFIADWKW